MWSGIKIHDRLRRIGSLVSPLFCIFALYERKNAKQEKGEYLTTALPQARNQITAGTAYTRRAASRPSQDQGALARITSSGVMMISSRSEWWLMRANSIWAAAAPTSYLDTRSVV